MSVTPLNIAILGAGLLGQLSAWRLLKHNHRVELFEQAPRHKQHSAAWTAAAMLSPMSEVVISDRRIYDLGMRSIALWESWLSELNVLDALFQRKGSVILAHAHDENELHQFYQELNYHLGEKNNAKWLTRNELLELENDLNPEFRQAIYLPDEAHLNNRALLNTLTTFIEENAIVHWQAPVYLNEENPQLAAFDLILDCRGNGANESLANLRGVRGEVLHLHCPEVSIQRPLRLMHPRYKLYLVPRPGQHFIIGATELESSDTSPVSVQSALELCSALYTLNPAFAEARIIELDANLRPALKDNMPAIVEQKHGDTRVIAINGLYRHGYLIAPALVETLLATI